MGSARGSRESAGEDAGEPHHDDAGGFRAPIVDLHLGREALPKAPVAVGKLGGKDIGHGDERVIKAIHDQASVLADANALSASQGEPPFAAGQYSETVFTPFTSTRSSSR